MIINYCVMYRKTQGTCLGVVCVCARHKRNVFGGRVLVVCLGVCVWVFVCNRLVTNVFIGILPATG